MVAPTDIYSATSGAPIYGGRAAPTVPVDPPVSEFQFDSVGVRFTSNDGAPPANTSNRILVVQLHGSSGQNYTNGRQYAAQCSGRLAHSDQTEFLFSTVLSTTPGIFLLRPIDNYLPQGSTRKESMWLGFKNMGTADVKLITEHRLDALMAWQAANLGEAPNKRCLTGGSMGGWGSMTYGMRRPALFCAVYADRPRWRYDNAVGNVAVADFNTTTLTSTPVASAPNLAAEDGSETYAQHLNLIAYVSDTTKNIPWLGWCVGRNDGFTQFSDHVAATQAMRAAKRGFAFAWNNGNHSVGSIMAQIFQSYPYGTFTIGQGYPLFTEHSGDQDPAVDLEGGINIGLSFRNVVETASGWSCEVTSVLGARTVKVEPISPVFTKSVVAKTVAIPAANSWVPVSFA